MVPRPEPDGGSAGTASCLGAAGASGYVAAYQHIHSLFVAAGAHQRGLRLVRRHVLYRLIPIFANYYPGGDVVDWIASRRQRDARATVAARCVHREFASWYSAFSAVGKPMMVSSTGADPGSQPAYFGQVLSASPGSVSADQGAGLLRRTRYGQWRPVPVGYGRCRVVRAVGGLTRLQPRPRAPSHDGLGVTSSIPAGRAVTLTSVGRRKRQQRECQLSGQRTRHRRCLFVPITTPATLPTSQLSAGVQSIVALYSGDAAFASSTSVPVTLTVDGPVPPLGGLRALPDFPRPRPSESTTSISSDVGVRHGHRWPASGPLQGSRAGEQGPPTVGSFVDPSGTSLQPGNPTGGIAKPVE